MNNPIISAFFNLPPTWRPYFLFFLLLFPFPGSKATAQVSDTIGRGTATANIYGPAKISTIGTTNATHSTKIINLFTQTELANIGIYPGAVLNSIAWQKSGTGVLINGTTVNITVSLRSNIDSISYSQEITANKYINDYVGSNFTFAGSQLFSPTGTNFPATTATWVPVNFSAPFTYQGGGLEVLMDALITPGPGATPPNAASAVINWFSGSTGFLYQCIYTNNVTSYNSTTPYYYANSKPNTLFNFKPATVNCSGTPVAGTIQSNVLTACPGMLLTNLRLKGASNVNGIKLQWEKKVSGQSAFTAIPNATGYEILDQLIKTPTEYRVVVTCGSTTSTSPVLNVLPTPFLTPNYAYDFERGAAWFASTVPNCWLTRRGLWEDTIEFTPQPSLPSGYATGNWASDGWKNSGTFGAGRIVMSAFTYDWLISPGINLGTGNWQLEFDLGLFNSNAATPGKFDEDDFFAVVISTDGGETWSNDNTLRAWSTAQTPLSADGTQHVVIPLSDYSGNIAIGFYGTGSGLNPIAPALTPDMMIDNFKIVPSCNPKTPAAITGPVLACRNTANNYTVPAVSGISSYTWIVPSGWSGTSTTNSISVSPNDSSGILQVIANTASCGSSDTQKIDIMVSPLPVIQPEGSPLQLCEGQSVALTTGKAVTHKWMLDDTIIANATDSAYGATKAGAYKVITNNGTCTDTSVAKNIKVNPLPVPVIIKSNQVLSTGDLYSSYQWNFNNEPVDGANNASFVVTDSGAYSVTVTDTNGCEATSASIIAKQGSAGIHGTGAGSPYLKTYPNPAKDQVHIEFSQPVKGDEWIAIMDVAGKTLLTKVVQGMKTTISLSSLSAGIYFVKVSNETTLLVSKIIKN